MKIKVKVKSSDLYYVSLFVWSFLSVLYGYTTVESSLNIKVGAVYLVAWAGIRVFLLLMIVLEMNQYTQNDLIIIALLLVLGYLTFRCSESMILYPLMWFLAASKGKDMRKSVKTLLFAQCLVTILVMSLSALGIIENRMMIRSNSGVRRYACGFLHPNTVGISLLQICMMLFFLKKNRGNWVLYPIYAVCFYFAYFKADSRTSCYLILFLALMTLLFSFAESRGFLGKMAAWGVKQIRLSLPVTLIFSFVCATGYFGSGFSVDTLQSRVEQNILYMRNYGMTLLGQPLTLGYLDAENTSSPLYTLDNGYIYLLLGFGIVNFVLFIFMYVLQIRYAIKSKEYKMLIVLAIYAFWGFFETAMIRVMFNFTLLFFSLLLWSGKDSGQRIQSEQKKRNKRK